MRLLFRNLAAFGGLFILVALDSATAMDPLFSRKAQAEVINRLAAPGDVVSTYHADYDRNCQSLSFYTRSRVVLLGTKGELKTGAALVPDAADDRHGSMGRQQGPGLRRREIAPGDDD